MTYFEVVYFWLYWDSYIRQNCSLVFFGNQHDVRVDVYLGVKLTRVNL